MKKETPMAKRTITTDAPAEVSEAMAPDEGGLELPATDGESDETVSAEAARGVMFRIPGGEARSAVLVGDFNGWSTDATPMEQVGDCFEVTVDLAPGEYRYRYLLDGERWENDWNADDYSPNQFGGDDSVRRV
jgi:1,4-alpha-glucan branching enzyme